MAELPDSELAPRVRGLQILVVALLTGVAVITGVAVYLQTANLVVPTGDTWLSMVAVGFGALMVILQLVVPRAVVEKARREHARSAAPPGGDGHFLLTLYQSRVLVGAALCEAGALAGVVAYLIEGNTQVLLLTLFMAGLLALRYPSMGDVRTFLDVQ
ncbi:MAG TPA: hypothetical protein VIL46_10555, partial [Gemmataceae bacterium]